jgi:hypothetical protein
MIDSDEKHTQTFMSQPKFKLTIPVFAWPKAVRTLNCMAAGISSLEYTFYEIVVQWEIQTSL